MNINLSPSRTMKNVNLSHIEYTGSGQYMFTVEYTNRIAAISWEQNLGENYM